MSARRPKIERGKYTAVIADRPLLKRMFSRITLEWFEKRPIHIKTRCWHFNGYKDGKGYGQIKIDGVALWAHRAYYSAFKRLPIQDGYEVDHECKNPSCVRPTHLTARPMPENRRAVRRASRSVE